MTTFPYTICFCYRGDLILMLHWNRPPNQGRWNGLGGKIQPGETPLICVQREMIEEAGIDLTQSPDCRFAGMVTWPSGADSTSPSTGMYAFLAELPPGAEIWEGERDTTEGRLCWKPLAWICDPQNTAVVGNIPYFLPEMFAQAEPQEYYCDYRDGTLYGVAPRPLLESLKVLS